MIPFNINRLVCGQLLPAGGRRALFSGVRVCVRVCTCVCKKILNAEEQSPTISSEGGGEEGVRGTKRRAVMLEK